MFLFGLYTHFYLHSWQIDKSPFQNATSSLFCIIKFWRHTFTEPCCALKYYPEIEICVKEQKGEQEAKRKEAQRLEDENFGQHPLGKIRTYLWNLFEYPETSREAQVSEMVLFSQFHFVEITLTLIASQLYNTLYSCGHYIESY